MQNELTSKKCRRPRDEANRMDVPMFLRLDYMRGFWLSQRLSRLKNEELNLPFEAVLLECGAMI